MINVVLLSTIMLTDIFTDVLTEMFTEMYRLVRSQKPIGADIAEKSFRSRESIVQTSVCLSKWHANILRDGMLVRLMDQKAKLFRNMFETICLINTITNVPYVVGVK